METRYFKRIAFSLLATLSLGFVLIACDKDNDDDNGNPPVTNRYVISGDASGSQAVPQVNTTATGTITGTYNADSNMLRYNINWNGLSDSVTYANFYGPAAAGEVGDSLYLITILTNGATGNANGSIVLSDSAERYLLDSAIYYNLHTALNGSGEIRGQVFAKKQ